jgi:predicted nuclease of predicted toxin-antitoxin system
LSLRLYLDDCIYSHELRRLLIEAGHDVRIPADVRPPLTGQHDQQHFAYANSSGRVLLTKNPRDFREFHRRFTGHPGILAVYQDNDPNRDMSQREIVQAIANLEATGVTLTGGFWPLNNYRW